MAEENKKSGAKPLSLNRKSESSSSNGKSGVYKNGFNNTTSTIKEGKE